MKIIHSRTFALEQELNSSKARIAQLEAEVLKWKQAYQQVWKRSAIVCIDVEESESSSNLMINGHTESTIPSYQKPTLSSKIRTAEPVKAPELKAVSRSSTRTSCGGYVYDDGALLEYPGQYLDKPRYFSHTEASARHARNEHYLADTFGRDNAPSAVACDANTTVIAQTAVAQSVVELTCSRCDMIDTASCSVSPDSLAARTRLNHAAFYRTSGSTCYVPIRLQSRLLRRALCLAQEAIWSALRAHWPWQQLLRYLEGPQEFGFGRTELEGRAWVGSLSESCGHPREAVMTKLLNCVDLRNIVCHPSQIGSEELDKRLREAQDLAVVLLDERRALKVRKLRDELQAATEAAHDEIEAFEPLAYLPFARPWALHHQRLFEEVLLVSQRQPYQLERYSATVMRAAKAWRWKYCRPGELDQVYLDNVETAKTFMRPSECGRRASVSFWPSSYSSRANPGTSEASTAAEPSYDLEAATEDSWGTSWAGSTADWNNAW